MTTMTRPHQRETAGEALEAAVRSASDLISDRIRAAGPDGLPLGSALDELADRGLSLRARSSVVTQLIREGCVELTTDRRLRWVDKSEGQ
jgi:hypothetical protein